MQMKSEHLQAELQGYAKTFDVGSADPPRRRRLQIDSPSLLEVEPLPDGPSVRIRRIGRGEARRGEARWVGHDA